MKCYLFFCLLPLQSWCCSYVEIPFPGSSWGTTNYAIARTMELVDMHGAISHEFEVVPANTAALERFGYVAAMLLVEVVGYDVVKKPTEGMNEKGLTVSALMFHESEYEEELKGIQTVNHLDVVHYILTRCETVDLAIQLLESVRVVSSLLTKTALLHWAITDASGKSVVVEYLKGKRSILTNTPRVMTNDPPIEWHWSNLNSYTNLSPKTHMDVESLQVEVPASVGLVPRSESHGWNLHGLPGDFTPTSRFVRLFYLRGFAVMAAKPENLDQAIVLGSALLNNVFIPFGAVASTSWLLGHEMTSYGVIKIPSEKKMLIRGYRNSQWRQIDLTKLNFKVSKSWPVEDGNLGIKDITHAAVPIGVGAARRSRSNESIAI